MFVAAAGLIRALWHLSKTARAPETPLEEGAPA